MDFTKIKAQGPWVFVELIKEAREDGLQKSTSGLLFLPNDNMAERTGLAKARVISVGKGIWDSKRKAYETPGFGPGAVITFRGFLAEANRPSYLNDDFCFIHLQDVLGEVDSVAKSRTVQVWVQVD
jgi:co-chaperonin GroES (HSP10)